MRYNTPLMFELIKSEYVPGSSPVEVSHIIEASVTSKNKTSIFHCNWTTNYGSLGISQHEQNVQESSRVRMKYVKQVVEAMRGSGLLYVYKNGIKDDEHRFVLNSSVDDIREEHKEIEFQVKKWVHK